MKAFWHEAQLSHAPRFYLQRGQLRPNDEVPARAVALLEGCRTVGLDIAAPPALAPDALLAVHEPAYLDFLRDGPGAWEALPDKGPEMTPSLHPTPEMLAIGARAPESVAGQIGWFAADGACPIAAETMPAALWSAACAIAAADEAAAGHSAYALCRPPGHHAYPARAGGHCYLNNAALAALRLRDRGMARVAVLDLDVHHGNGTQHIFWDRDDVLFASIHGDTRYYYPWFVGDAAERGAGAGEGCTLNLPLARGADDGSWLAALDDAASFVRAARVDALVVSLGFDAAACEPLGFLSVSDDGFARAAAAVAALGKPAAIVQEGGYAVDALARLLARFFEGFGARL